MYRTVMMFSPLNYYRRQILAALAVGLLALFVNALPTAAAPLSDVVPEPQPGIAVDGPAIPEPQPGIAVDGPAVPEPQPGIAVDGRDVPEPQPGIAVNGHDVPEPQPGISVDGHDVPEPQPGIAVDAPALPPLIHLEMDVQGRPTGLVGRGRQSKIKWDDHGWTISRFGPAPEPSAIERRVPGIQRFAPTDDPSGLGAWQAPAGRPVEEVRVELVGARPGAFPEGMTPLGGTWNVMHGPRSEWRIGMPTYGGVAYRNVWPGIDMIWTATPDGLQAKIYARPDADLSLAAFAVRGGTTEGGADGRVTVQTGVGPAMALMTTGLVDASHTVIQGEVARVVVEPQPGVTVMRLVRTPRVGPVPADPNFTPGVAGLLSDPKRTPRVGPVPADPNSLPRVPRVGPVPADPNSLPRVPRVGPVPSDPTAIEASIAGDLVAGAFVYSGIWGMDSDDRGLGVAVAPDGAAYVCGHVGAIGKDGVDAFVYKVSPEGDRVEWVTTVGGDDVDTAFDLAVDDEGRTTFIGATISDQDSLPVTGGPDLTYGGNQDALVGRISADGEDLVWLGYVGGASTEFAEGVAIDKTGATYVTGLTGTRETTFPAKVGPDTTWNGMVDTFIVKLAPNPTSANRMENVVYGGYIGGPNHDAYIYQGADGESWATAGHVAVGADGAAYISGATKNDQNTFPTGSGFGELPGADQTFAGDWDAWAVKIRPDGSRPEWATYVGGKTEDLGFGMGVGPDGAAYFTGFTDSAEDTLHPVGGPDLTFNGMTDALAVKVNPDGRSFGYVGYVGGEAADAGVGSTVDDNGRLILIGYTGSTEATFPAIVGPDLTFNGTKPDQGDGFVAMVVPDPAKPDPHANFAYAGYIGGKEWDQAFWVAVDKVGAVYVAGDTDSGQDTFPDGQGRGTRPGFGGENKPTGTNTFLVKVAPAPLGGPDVPTATPTRPPVVLPTAVPTSAPKPSPTAGAPNGKGRVFLPWLAARAGIDAVAGR